MAWKRRDEGRPDFFDVLAARRTKGGGQKGRGQNLSRSVFIFVYKYTCLQCKTLIYFDYHQQQTKGKTHDQDHYFAQPRPTLRPWPGGEHARRARGLLARTSLIVSRPACARGLGECQPGGCRQ